MSLQLQAIVSLNKDGFTGGLSSMSAMVGNVTGAMSMAFGGVAAEILAMGKAFGPVGSAMAVMKESIGVGAGFEQQVANIASVSGLAGVELGKVATAIRDMAEKTRYTATQAGDAMYSLASAGVTGADALSKTLEPALLLAGATLSSTTLATEAMTAALANFQIDAKDATRVADQFAGAIATSPATMERMSEAMIYAGPAAAAFGISLEKTVAEIAAFHKVGLRGEQAGTSFRMALIQLTEEAAKTGKEASDVTKALKNWDAATEGITGAVERLNKKNVEASDVILALGARAGPGMAAMMKLGSDAMGELAGRVSAAADVSKMYEIQMATLSGRFAIFKSSVEEVGIKIFEVMVPALTAMTEGMTAATQGLGKLLEALFSGDWEGAADMIRGLGVAIMETMTKAVADVRATVESMTDAVMGVDWSKAFQTMQAEAVAAFAVILGLAAVAGPHISDALESIDWAAVWEGAKQGFVMAVNFWYGHVAATWARIADFLKSVTGDQVWSVLRDSAVVVWAEIQDVAKGIWPAIQEYAESAWSAVAEAGRIAFETVSAAWKSVTLPQIMDGIRSAFFAAADAVKAFGQSMGENIGLPLTLDAIARLIDTLKVTFANLTNAARILFDALADVDWAVVLSDAVRLVDLAMAGIVTVIDTALRSVNALIEGWRNLSDGTKDVILVLTGTAGVVLAIEACVLGLVSATKAAIAFGVAAKALAANQIQAIAMGLPIVNKAFMAFPLHTAGAVAGAAAFGAALGTLIRQIPGVADALDNAFIAIGEWTGLSAKEDQTIKELAARTKKLREERNAAVAAAKAHAEAQSKVVDVAKAETAAVEEATVAIEEQAASVPVVSGFLDDYQARTKAATAATYDEVLAFNSLAIPAGKAKAAVAELAPAAQAVADDTGKASDGVKDLAKSMEGMTKQAKDFKTAKLTASDISAFTMGLRQLKESLTGQSFDFSSLKFPNFAGFKLPNISQHDVSKFATSLRLLVMSLTGIPLGSLKIPDFSKFDLPKLDNSAVTKFLAALQTLKTGMMKLDFGELGRMDIKVAADKTGAAKTLDQILALLKGARGVVWA